MRRRENEAIFNNFEWCGEVLKHGSLDVGTVISVSVWPLKNGHFVYIPIIIGLRKVKWSFLRHHYRLSAYILTRRLVHNIHDVVTFATIGSHTYSLYFLTKNSSELQITKNLSIFWQKLGDANVSIFLASCGLKFQCEQFLENNTLLRHFSERSKNQND